MFSIFNSLNCVLRSKFVCFNDKDNADYCCHWKNAKNTMINRLQDNDFYADRAIVRITVCARPLPKNSTVDEHMEEVINDYVDNSRSTNYIVKPLTMKQWIRKYETLVDYSIPQENEDGPAFAYAGNMLTMMFMILKL